MHRRPPARVVRRLLALAAALCLVSALAACGGSDSSTDAKADGTTTTAVAKPGVAKVTSLTVPPSVDCGTDTSTTFTIDYATEQADSVELYVDGAKQDGRFSTTGSESVPVRCDGLPHDVVVRAIDADGNATVGKTQITTRTANG